MLGMTTCQKNPSDPYVPGATVWGYVILPEALDGNLFVAVLDRDTVAMNDNFIQGYETICRSDDSLPYAFYDVPSGEYYLYCAVFIDCDDWKVYSDADFFGYYGSTNGPPESANVVVPPYGEVVVDLTLKAIE
jgi:hypothetical protein